MITFKKIRYKNFLSSGDQFIEIDFLKNKTNLIVGTNGAGKSTCLDALCFVLFNKSFRKITKPQLVNSVNEKGCLVEIAFDINGKKYLVRRGIKPNIFDIYVNGKLLDKQSEDRLNQKILEENILKLNYKSFTQIVILGSSTFVPFMQLTTSNRREVIEDLLDIRVFSTMGLIIKDKIKSLKNNINSDLMKRESLEEKIEMQKNFITELKVRENANILNHKKRIEELNLEIDKYSHENSIVEESTFAKTKQLNEINLSSEKLGKLMNLKGKLSQKVSQVNEQEKFFKVNSVCPTCTQKIEEDFRLNKIEDVQNKFRELQKGYKEIEETIVFEKERERQFNVLSKEILKLNNEISQNNTRISANQQQVRKIENEIQILTNQLTDRNTEHEKLEEFQEKLNTLIDELVEKKEKVTHHDFAYSLLKDDGVKTKIIKKYIPFINQQVNRYLQMMDFYVNFHLDEEFNETVQSPIHENFSYSSFSEGEKAKINLALIFAWREVAAAKNSVNTNLLIFDEVFDGSLDSFGTDEFLKIIRYVIKDANIFVISHKTGMEDKFQSVIKFDKFKGFSRIVP